MSARFLTLVIFVLALLLNVPVNAFKKNKASKQAPETPQATKPILDSDAYAAVYSVEGKIDILSGHLDPTVTKVLLNGGAYVTFVKADGSFVFRDLAPATYVLEVNNVNFAFEPVRVDISASDKGKVRASSFSQPVMAHPLLLKPKGRFDYFTERKVFNPLNMLKNPTVIMMLVMGGMAFGLPKMVDKEQLAESQKESQAMLASLTGKK